VAIGASFSNGKNEKTKLSGEVRIFTLSDSSWIQVGKSIYGESAGDLLGTSVSLSANGKTVAIGSTADYYNNVIVKKNTKSGKVRIFTLSDSSWIQVGQDIDGKDPGEQSGFSVSLNADGTIVAFGAPSKETIGVPRLGQVRVYTSLPELKTISVLLSAKKPVSEILAAGYTNTKLIKEGLTASVLRSNGYNAKDLKQLKFSVRQMKQAKFPLSSLLRANFLLSRITAYYGAEKFLALGIDAEQLRKRGISEERLFEMGFPISSPIAP
jgi:hypothetical protein